MDYKKYIELGFTRTDMNDTVEFNQTGFGGFTLVKELKNNQSIEISSGGLTTPHLYIKKKGKDAYHIIRISDECVVDLCHHDSKS